MQLVLERPDLAGQHRLGDVQRVGGPAEVQMLGNGQEVPQLAQVQVQVHHSYRTGI
jgi:hypothetical protein